MSFLVVDTCCHALSASPSQWQCSAVKGGGKVPRMLRKEKTKLANMSAFASKSGRAVHPQSPPSGAPPGGTTELASLFECPVCFDYVLPPILQCQSGHLVCANCRPKLTCCPTCRGPLGNIRNLAMEKVASTVMFPCKYSSSGCSATLLHTDKTEHEDTCEFRPYMCPCPGASCKWQGSLEQVMPHLMSVHKSITTLQGTLCKGRWNNIRDNYRKSLKRTSTKSRQNAKKMIIYKNSKQLSFLKKYIYERETKGNIASQQDEENNQDDDAQQHGDKEEDIVDDAVEPTVPDVGLHEGLQTQHSPSPKPTFEAPGKLAKKKVATQQTASAKLMEYFISKQENQTTSTSPHPVDAFLAGIAPTLKTLIPYYLNVANSEIFATVQKYEMQMLMNQH